MDWLLHSFHQHKHKPPVKFLISSFHFSNTYLNSSNFKTSCAPMTVNWNFYPEPSLNKLLKFNQKPPASTISLTQNDTKNQTSRKLKIFCSIGGKIIANPRNGNLHYVGGQSRIIAFHRDMAFQEFYCKMEEACGGPVRIFYQFSKQSLDTLISVYLVEDFENMMDEIDYLSKASTSGSTKLRVFLFPQLGLEVPSDRFDVAASNDCGSSNIKKTNEVFASETNGSNNLGNQLDTINMGNQPGVTTCNAYSLFSDNDPWKILGLQLSNIN